MAKVNKFGDIFKYVKGASILPDYTNITYNSNFRHKMRGIDGNGVEKDFSDHDKEEILKGLEKFIRDARKVK